MKTERDMFDEWYKSEYPLDYEHYVNEQDIGLFTKLYLRCFASWQASASREGYKLVPIETLEECLSWANCASSESWNDEQRDEIDKHYKVIEKAMMGAAP